MMLHEIHTKDKSDSWNDNWITCQCSYCIGNTKLHYGLNIPENISWTSWFVIKYWNNRYIRFTIPLLKILK